MNWRFWHKKWLLAAVVITITVVVMSLFVATMKFDYDRDSDAAMQYFATQPGMNDAFTALQSSTPNGAVVFCWWDYGRSVIELSHRQVIEAYPSREIAESIGSTRSLLGNAWAQMFGRWGSNGRIQDLAVAFMVNEEQSLQVLRKYNASYALVFVPDELQKFYWIASIAGFNATDYLTINQTTTTYEPTPRGQEVTLLRLVFDDTWQPRHFTKIFANDRAKIYRINY